MNSRRIEQAIELGKRLDHFFVALVGSDGFPYLTYARKIDQVSETQLTVEEWICPLTVKHFSENSKMAVLIWDPASDDGYEILGEVLMFESLAFLNGFAPEVEEKAYLPQVKRRLIVRAEKIAAYSRAFRCNEIQQITTSKATVKPSNSDDHFPDVPVCLFAPEWAEHARLDRSDEPCDDGRAGSV
jgi:hypothetical protein